MSGCVETKAYQVVVESDPTQITVVTAYTQGPAGPPGKDGTGSGGSLTVEGEGGTPSIEDVGTIQFIGATVEALGGGGAKVSGLKGDTGDTGATGDDGWSPLLAVEPFGDDAAVLKVVDWFGGDGTKPTTGLYLGEEGLVEDPEEAMNIRGAVGPNFLTGGTGTNLKGVILGNGSNVSAAPLGDFVLTEYANTLVPDTTVDTPITIVGISGMSVPLFVVKNDANVTAIRVNNSAASVEVNRINTISGRWEVLADGEMSLSVESHLRFSSGTAAGGPWDAGVRRSSTGVVDITDGTTSGLSYLRLLGTAVRSGSSNPSKTDIVDGFVSPWRNTTSGVTGIWGNVGDTLFTMPLLGSGSVGLNLVGIATPAAVSWTRVNTDGTVDLRTASETRGDLGSGTVGDTLFQAASEQSAVKTITAKYLPVSSTSFTLNNTDHSGVRVSCTGGTDVTVTVANSLPESFSSQLLRATSADVYIVPDSGGTQYPTSKQKIPAEWAAVVVEVINSSGHYVVHGGEAA